MTIITQVESFSNKMKWIYVKISIGDKMFTHSKKEHKIIWAIGMGILFTLLETILYGISLNISKDPGICYFLTYIASIIIIILIFKDSLKEDIKNLKQDIKGNITKLLILHFIFIFCVYISNYILYLLLGSIANNEETIREIIIKSPIFMSISVCFLGPIMEELIYRYPYKNVKGNKKIIFATYTILFAALHILGSTSLTDLLYIIPYIFLSLSFSYSFYKTNNIITSIFFHILNNTFTVVLLLIGG